MIMDQCNCDSIQLRDARYDQVVHMTTAANGAEAFYQLDNNPARSEGLVLAREMDNKAANVSESGVKGTGRRVCVCVIQN